MPSRPPSSTTSTRAAPLPPAERRERIVEAVTELVVERGERVTSRALADAAGVSEGTVFKCFDSKDDVVRSVVDAVLDSGPLDRSVDEIVDGDAPWIERLETVIALLQTRTARVFAVLSGVDERLHPSRPGPLPVPPGLVRLLDEAPTALRRPAVDSARALRALTFSTCHPLLVEQPTPPAEVADLFLHGHLSGTTTPGDRPGSPADPELPES
ncbi:MAG: TetR/AcrR family transcriptional regulator [Acidimicrobiales bacterium]